MRMSRQSIIRNVHHQLVRAHAMVLSHCVTGPRSGSRLFSIMMRLLCYLLNQKKKEYAKLREGDGKDANPRDLDVLGTIVPVFTAEMDRHVFVDPVNRNLTIARGYVDGAMARAMHACSDKITVYQELAFEYRYLVTEVTDSELEKLIQDIENDFK